MQSRKHFLPADVMPLINLDAFWIKSFSKIQPLVSSPSLDVQSQASTKYPPHL
jgi:hypothetical protein